MPARKDLQEYVKNELPYAILMKLYENSRASLQAMGREFGVSYHTVAAALQKMEEKYNISYTLQLDERKLGFTNGMMLMIKFERMPDLSSLKERLRGDIYVQDAYIGSGDFDLILYVVGLEIVDFDKWRFKLETGLFEYSPVVKFYLVDQIHLGFFPISSELIMESTSLNPLEKKVLALLNENSRIKLTELVKKTKSTQTKVLYTIRKMKKEGIIKKFTMLVQNPEKKLYMAYGMSNMPSREHDKLLLQYLKLIVSEDLHEVSNNYSLITDGIGHYGSFYICNFKDSEEAQKHGPDMLYSLWAPEHFKAEKAILTDLIKGKWPFHLESYETQKRYIKDIESKLSHS